jgi:dCTP deaminase
MILSSQEIRYLKILSPFKEKYKVGEISGGLSVASYDVALDQDIELCMGKLTLASTIEHFDMPSNVCAVVHDKSTWARCGVTVLNTFIDPGWRGFLTLEISIHEGYIKLKKGIPIAQIVFSYLNEIPEKLYDGKYQDQQKGVTKPIL